MRQSILILIATILLATVTILFSVPNLSDSQNHSATEEENIHPEETTPHPSLLLPNSPLKRKSPPDFMQGIYATANIAARGDFDQFLTRAKDSGINTIVFDIKEKQGVVYFSLKDYPQFTHLYSEPIYDLESVISMIHSHQMYAIARIVQFYNTETAIKHPELQPEHRQGGYWREYPDKPTWLDPSNPIVQEELLHLLEIVAKSSVDEIQLDYIRFPTEGRLSNAIFHFQKQDAEKAKADPTYTPREKRDIITDYSRRAREICDKYNVRLTADIFAIVAWNRTPDIRNIGQDIPMLSPYFHAIHPMIYSSHFSDDFDFDALDFVNKPYPIVKAGIQRAKALADTSCTVIPYLQAFQWRVDYTPEYIYDQLKAAVDTNSKGFLLWNSYSSYDNALRWLKRWNESKNRGVILRGYTR